jgi:glycosyltransferase involved in cell wall biosynthesis
MAHPLRLAIAAARFWPQVEDQAAHLLRLAEELLAAGHQVTVVTPLWKRSWPRQMVVGPVPLVRLRGSPTSSLGTVRWMYSLSAWLREHAPGLDGVLACGLRHEAYVTMGTAQKTRTPTAVLAGQGDLVWQRSATFGGRIAARCRTAAAVIAPSSELADELAAAGYARQQITVIPRGVAIPDPRSPAAREAARAALAAVNYDLVTTPTAPVAVACGRLDAEHRFGDLVRAWRIVNARRSEARLWIVGDGPLRDQLYRQIGDLDLRFRVLIPGSFDGLRELIEAADLFLAPAPQPVPAGALLKALAAGLPVIAADVSSVQDLAGEQAPEMSYPAGDIKALADAITRHFDQPAAGIVRAAAIRQRLHAAPTPAAEATAYAAIFEHLGSRTRVEQTSQEPQSPIQSEI